MNKPSTSNASKTDWKRRDALRDEDIDFSDSPEITFEINMKVVVRRGVARAPLKRQITVRLDADILERSRSVKPNGQTRINALLRANVEKLSGRK